jgi:hypothetical protein
VHDAAANKTHSKNVSPGRPPGVRIEAVTRCSYPMRLTVVNERCERHASTVV